MKLLLWPPVDEGRLAAVQQVAGNATVVNAVSADEALVAITDAEGFFGKLTPALLAAARQLRWVQSPTASLEHYLFPALVSHPCVLTNMRGLFSDVIADHVMGYVLTFARNLHLYRDQQRQGNWSPIGDETALPDFSQGPGTVTPVDRAHRHLSDCTLGVVGVGAIGEEIFRRAVAFGMAVRGVDPRPRVLPGLGTVEPLERLEDLLGACDFVVIAAPHTPRTERLFDRNQLSRLRRDAYLINIGRGAIVDLSALTEVLQRGALAGAALDVCEMEPLPADHPLWRMPQVLITPHVAAASPRIAERHLAVLAENVRRFVHGEPLRNVVNKTEWF